MLSVITAFRALHVDQSESDSVREVLFVKGEILTENIHPTFRWHILLYDAIFPAETNMCATDAIHQTRAAKFKSITGTSYTQTKQNKKHAYLIYICCLGTTKYLA